jgi:hypothetical protein
VRQVIDRLKGSRFIYEMDDGARIAVDIAPSSPPTLRAFGRLPRRGAVCLPHPCEGR